MKFLGLTQNSEDFTSKEYVAQQIDIQGGKIDTLSVDGVQQEIINKNVNIDLSAKADVTALATKTTQEISNANGKAQIINEADGGGIFFIKNDGTRKSFIGVNDSTAGGPDAQIYAVDPSDSNKGAKLDILKTGIYYTVGSEEYASRIVDDNKLITKSYVDAIDYQIEKLAEAETGYLATYQLINKDGQKCGASINIAKDLVISKAEVKTCTQDDVPVEGYRVGDKYIDFTINTISGQDHIYLLVKELVDVYRADETTLTLDSSTNTFSIKQAYTDAIESKINVVDGKLSQEAATREAADNTINATKVDKPVEPVVGQGVNVPYYFDVTYGADKATVKDYTIDLLDNTKAPQQFSLDINAATTSNAGLMTAADKTKLDNVENLIPTKVSELTNDSGFLTEHQSLVAYRTSAAQDTIDAGKQSVISDLDTIRSGAALGATSIQSHQDISGKVDKPNEPVVGQGVNVPYYFDVNYEATKAVVKDYTIDLLDKTKAPQQFSLDINSATTTQAGLMSAADKVRLDGINVPTKTSELTNDSGFLTEHQSLAAYRTSAAQDAIDSGKQATIDDLETIRSGAALGATAIQSHQDISGKVDKPVEPVVGQGVNVPYYFDVVYNPDKVTVRDYTVDLLDNTKASGVYSLDVNAATTTNAGLMSASDKVKLNNIPTQPTTDGTYVLECSVVGGVATYNWVLKA